MLFTELDRRVSVSNNNQDKITYKEENNKCRKNLKREKQRDAGIGQCNALLHPHHPHHPLSDSDHTMEIWFECTTSGQRCAAEVGESCSAADLQERAVAVLYPQSVLSAEAVGLCVDDADGEVLAPEVLIADTALCAGGTVYVRKQDSSAWVPRCYDATCSVADVCEDTVAVGGEHAVTINLVTTEVTPLPPIGGPRCKMVLMPHHIVYCSESNVARFKPRDNSAEVVVVSMVRMIESLVAMRVTEAVLIGTSKQIVQYSCKGVKMRTIDHSGYSFAVSPCETLLLSNRHPNVDISRLDTPELRVVHRVRRGKCMSFLLQPSFSPDASLAVLSCGSKHTVCTIDIVSGRVLCTLPKGKHMSGACFSACSRYLFTVCIESVQQWDARSGAPMGRTSLDNAASVRVHASPDGRRLVVVLGRGISVLDIAAINMQVSEKDALQHVPHCPLPLEPPTPASPATSNPPPDSPPLPPRVRPCLSERTVVATESRCSGCVCS